MKPLCLGCMTGIDGEVRREPYVYRAWDNATGGFATQYASAPLHPDELCLKLFQERRATAESPPYSRPGGT